MTDKLTMMKTDEHSNQMRKQNDFLWARQRNQSKQYIFLSQTLGSVKRAIKYKLTQEYRLF